VCGIPAEERVGAYRLLTEAAGYTVDRLAQWEHEESSGLSLNVVLRATTQWSHLGEIAARRDVWRTEEDRSEATEMWLTYTGILQEHLAGMLLLGTYGDLQDALTRELRGAA
jgi:hypothetical protein